MEKIKAIYNENKELVLYIIFGLGTTIINWGSYTIFLKIVTQSIMGANLFSWCCATVFAFLTNKLYVFESDEFTVNVLIRELLLFVSTRIGTGIMEMALVPFLVNLGFRQGLWGVEGLYAKISVSLFVVLVNYVVSKKMIFKK